MKIKNMLLFIKSIHKRFPAAVTIILILIVLISLSSISLNLLLANLIDNIDQIIKNKGLINSLFFVLILIVIIRFSRIMFNEGLSLYCNNISERLSHSLQLVILEKVKKLTFSSYDHAGNSDLMKRVRDSSQGESSKLLISIAQTIYSTLIILLYCFFLGRIAWYITLIMLVTTLISILISIKFGLDVYLAKRRISRSERMANYYESLLVDRIAAKELRIFNLINHIIKRWVYNRKKINHEEISQLSKHSFIELFGKMTHAFGFFVCLVLAWRLYLDGMISIGSFVFVLNVGTLFIDDVTVLQTQIEIISKFYIYVQDVIQFEKLPEEANDISFDTDLKICVNLEDVYFKYPGASRYALRGVSVNIKNREKIVCVGKNGSGKTTFIKLILGLYDTNKGKIRVDGNELNLIRHNLRRNSICILQDFNHYKMKIDDFLTLGNDISKDKLNKIKDSNLLSFINHLPHKGSTYLGELDSGSINISGGQWQRLVIGRAMLKDPLKLVILDEFTSSLDPLVESSLFDEIQPWLENKTAIIASHRLGVCSFADTILVFDKGMIVEQGSHQDLLLKGGYYAKMYQQQVQMFK